MTMSEPLLASGDRLGPYRVDAALGAGGMGEVYRAVDTRLGRAVAVKVLSAHRANDPERLKRFEQEARVVASLSHSNVLALHDVGSQDGVDYAVFELLEGQTLRQRMESGALPLSRPWTTECRSARGSTRSMRGASCTATSSRTTCS
jgi:serine/threonine protein kinase